MSEMLLGDRFVLRREIGSGGMARVFLGDDTVLDRPVAVKVLNPGHDETDIGARFRREGRTAARLSHPNIVQVYDAGEADLEGKKVSYIVMEYVPSGDLKRMIDEKGTLPEGDLARVGAGAAAGLAHAHERGVIHRDVKPHNVLIDAYGEPKLTDFGIARALDATTSNNTRTGAYLGTALYSAPEQLRGQGVTPKSDVYSLGVTLYQAAVGAVPFVGTPIEVAGQHIHQDPASPTVDGVAASESLERLILDCLEKDPEARPSAREVHERLRKEEGRIRKHAAPPPPPDPQPAQRQQPRPSPAPSAPVGSRRRRRGPLLLAAAALLVALLGLAVFYAFRGDNGSGTASNPPQSGQRAQSPANDGGNARPASDTTQKDQAPAGQTSAGQAGGDSAGAQADQQQGTTPEAGGQGSGAEGSLTQQAAARTVDQMYQDAVSRNYDASYALLSQGFRDGKAPTEPQWTNQFETLQSLEFVEGPTVQVSGNTATVTGTTIARHTDRTERNVATWTLVNEGGEWKVDDITIQSSQLV